MALSSWEYDSESWLTGALTVERQLHQSADKFISWQDSDAGDKLKKQKQSLMKKLQETFQLSEDPIPWSRKERCYKPRFVIRADNHVLHQL